MLWVYTLRLSIPRTSRGAGVVAVCLVDYVPMALIHPTGNTPQSHDVFAGLKGEGYTLRTQVPRVIVNVSRNPHVLFIHCGYSTRSRLPGNPDCCEYTLRLLIKLTPTWKSRLLRVYIPFAFQVLGLLQASVACSCTSLYTVRAL